MHVSLQIFLNGSSITASGSSENSELEESSLACSSDSSVDSGLHSDPWCWLTLVVWSSVYCVSFSHEVFWSVLSIKRLSMAPITQTSPKDHQAMIEKPLCNPCECRYPVIEGPSARLRLATDDDKPLIDPMEFWERIVLASNMFTDGKQITCNVILPSKAT